jgi:alpha-mannosidase
MRLADGPAMQRYRLDYDWALPQGLDATRQRRQDTLVDCPLRVVVSLAEDSRRVGLEVTFDNRARDHRLRICFPGDIDSDVSYSEGQFDVVERPVQPQPTPPEAWVEDPPYTHPQQGWMDLSDGRRGLCIVNRGLPEFEVLDTPRREIAITLLRAVGWLGAGPEMLTADAGAGPHIPTPEGQIQRKLTFHLAIVPHAGIWDEAEVWRQAHMHNTPPRSITVDRSLAKRGQRSGSGSFLQLEGDNVALDAVKRSEQGDALIVRMHNPASNRTSARLTPPFVPVAGYVVGLDEELRPAAAQGVGLDTDGRIHLELGPKEIVSLKLVGLSANREK